MFRKETKYLIAIGFALVLGLLITIAVIGIRQMTALNDQLLALFERHATNTNLVFTMYHAARERALALHSMAITQDPFEKDEHYMAFNEMATRFALAREQMLKSDLTPQERAVLDQQRKALNVSVPLQNEVSELLRDGRIEAADRLLLTKALPAQNRLLETLSELIAVEGDLGRTQINQAARSYHTAYIFMTMLGAAAFLLGLIIALYVSRRVSRTENELFHEKELAQITLHSIGDAVITTNNQGQVEYINPVAEQMTGWKAAAAQHQPLHRVFNIIDEVSREPINSRRTRADLSDPLADTGAHALLVRKDGQEFIIENSSAPIRDRDGRVIGSVLVFRDVTRARFLAQQLTWQASHDALTGLANRREFEHQLRQLLESAETLNKHHALLYIDLDQFKVVNDTCGHVAGDELLRQLSALLVRKLRESDILARLGGDEFGVLLEGCPLDQALRIANDLREAVQQFRFVWLDKVFEVGISIGLVAITSGAQDLTSILSAADEACYTAKDKGRNRVHVYQQDDTDLAQRHGEMQWVSRIKRAFDEGRFRLYYQTIAPLHDDQVSARHYEILLRMVDESGKIVPPMAFIPAAERYGIMPTIDRWVIRTLFQNHGHHLREAWVARDGSYGNGHALYSINLSGASINDDQFLDYLRDQLTLHKIPPQSLCFEITETAAITNLNKASYFMYKLKQIGCHFSLDDFGSGMSSFAYLKNLPVDFLKIDGSFVVDMTSDPVDYALVEAINRVGHVLGIRTVAESAETAAIMSALESLGVDYVQGDAVDEPRNMEYFAEETTLEQSLPTLLRDSRPRRQGN